jgi:hypothetical protein
MSITTVGISSEPAKNGCCIVRKKRENENAKRFPIQMAAGWLFGRSNPV